jgi:predicted dehydrogenase
MKIGILGLGEGRSTMSAALASPKLELKMVCDRDMDTCKQRAHEFNFHNYTTNYQDMLDDAEIDIIAIYTPDHLHAQHVKQALLAGKHVVCTKPFIDDLADAQELLELAQKSGKKIFIGQSSRFFEPAKRQRKDFEAGLIGDLITIEGEYSADHRWFLEKPWALEKSLNGCMGALVTPLILYAGICPY